MDTLKQHLEKRDHLPLPDFTQASKLEKLKTPPSELELFFKVRMNRATLPWLLGYPIWRVYTLLISFVLSSPSCWWLQSYLNNKYSGLVSYSYNSHKLKDSYDLSSVVTIVNVLAPFVNGFQFRTFCGQKPIYLWYLLQVVCHAIEYLNCVAAVLCIAYLCWSKLLFYLYIFQKRREKLEEIE